MGQAVFDAQVAEAQSAGLRLAEHGPEQREQSGDAEHAWKTRSCHGDSTLLDQPAGNRGKQHLNRSDGPSVSSRILRALWAVNVEQRGVEQ